MMKGTLVLAESATQHPDGTFSLLRGGIGNVWGPKPPYGLEGALVIRVLGDMGDRGPHKFDLRFVDSDGKNQAPTINGSFTIPEGGGDATMILAFQTQFQAKGSFSFILRVDNVELDRWTIHVRDLPQPPRPAAPEPKSTS